MERRVDPVSRVILAAVLSISALIVIGYTILLFNPPSELDKRCLNNSLADMNKCIKEYYEGK
jgi:hypothetical protein